MLPARLLTLRRCVAAATGAGVSAMVAGSVMLSSDSRCAVLHECLVAPVEAATTDMTIPGHAGVLGALMMTKLPVDELKVRLFRVGALDFWCWLLSKPALEQQAVAVTAINSLLQGDAALACVYSDHASFSKIVQSLGLLLVPRPVFGGDSCSLSDWQRAHELHDALELGATIASHPAFAESCCSPTGPPSDLRDLVLGLLEEGSSGSGLHPNADLQWAALAAAAASQPSFATVMIQRGYITGKLVRLVSDERATFGLTRDETEQANGFARVALQRLAKTGNSLGRGDAEAWQAVVGRSPSPMEAAAEPALPLRPPPPTDEVARSLQLQSAIVNALVGGVAWGLCRGLPRKARQLRPVWVAVASTAAGAGCIEVVSQGFVLLRDAVRTGKVPKLSPYDAGGKAIESPLFVGLSEFLAAKVAEIFTLGSVLVWLLEPSRAPFAFGGWVVGRTLGAALRLSELPDSVDVQADIQRS
uniref:Uncharacterized protein n=1 Tax=Chrysotila carterae TaxID=13221 RepID=A0A7S4FAM2_CHRCT